MSDEHELLQRLAAIARGPWAEGMGEARRRLATRSRLRVVPAATAPIALDKIELSTPDRRKSALLRTVLRPHFEDRKGITDPKEIETRDALDQALTVPQLYELAVQTGYLPAELVREPAREILTELLWSPAARDFVAAYDYLSIPMLAARVGVSGFGEVRPPPPGEGGALRFAGFLAHLRAFHADEEIQAWTAFMDDYTEEPKEQERLRAYLRGKLKAGPARSGRLLNGGQLFVASLANAFDVLHEDELGRFGLIHAYWLQKFFGYELAARGYVKDVARWGREDSWARTLAASRVLVPPTVTEKIGRLLRRQFERQVKLLEKTFDAVRSLAKSARPKRAARGRTR